MKVAVLAFLVVPGAAAAQVEPPAYFVDAAFETSTAQVLAVTCPTLSVDPAAMAARGEVAMARLTADGFTSANLAIRMADPAPLIGARQQVFLAKHDLFDGAPAASVCAAGRAEIAEKTAIGSLLLEIEG